MPSNHLVCFPFSFCLSLSQHQGLFQWVRSSHQVAKVLELQLQHQSSQWLFRVDFLLDWLVWSPYYPRDSQESSPAPQLESINSLALSLLFGPTLTSVHNYWKNHSFDYMDLLAKWFLCVAGSSGKASAYSARDLCLIPGSGRSPGEENGNPLQCSYLKNSMDRGACGLQSMGPQELNTTEQLPHIARFVLAFLPRSRCLPVSWLQSPSTGILEPKKIKSVTASPLCLPYCDRTRFHVIRYLNVEFSANFFTLLFHPHQEAL